MNVQKLNNLMFPTIMLKYFGLYIIYIESDNNAIELSKEFPIILFLVALK